MKFSSPPPQTCLRQRQTQIFKYCTNIDRNCYSLAIYGLCLHIFFLPILPLYSFILYLKSLTYIVYRPDNLKETQLDLYLFSWVKSLFSIFPIEPFLFFSDPGLSQFYLHPKIFLLFILLFTQLLFHLFNFHSIVF